MAGGEKRLADRLVKAREPRVGIYIVPDSEIGGFGVRVAPNGAKSWVLRYRWREPEHSGAGKQYRATLGTYPGVSAELARREATSWRCKIDPREDHPAAERVQVEPNGVLTCRRLLDR